MFGKHFLLIAILLMTFSSAGMLLASGVNDGRSPGTRSAAGIQASTDTGAKAATVPKSDTLPRSELAADGSLTIVDSFGRTVSFNSYPKTIVSLAPGITETIFALGYGDMLVGRSDFCNFPAEAAIVPALGNLMEPNIEAIAAVSPDVILASTHFSKSALEKLETTGQKVVILMGQDSFNGVYNSIIRPLSILLDDPDAGERLIASMKATVEIADAGVASFNRRPTAYFVVGFGEGGDWTAGGDTFLGQMLEMAGVQNIASDLNGWSYSLESLVEADPEIIFLPDWAMDIFPQTPIYRDLTAVRKGQLYVIDEDAISRQGARMAEAYASLVAVVEKVVEKVVKEAPETNHVIQSPTSRVIVPGSQSELPS